VGVNATIFIRGRTISFIRHSLLNQFFTDNLYSLNLFSLFCVFQLSYWIAQVSG